MSQREGRGGGQLSGFAGLQVTAPAPSVRGDRTGPERCTATPSGYGGGWAGNRGAVGRGEPQRQPRLQINRGLETPGKREQESPVCVCFSYSSLSASHTPGVTSRTAVACAGICLCPETRRCSEPAFPDPRCGSDFSRRSGFCGCRGGRGDEPPPSKAIPGYYCYPTGKPAPDALTASSDDTSRAVVSKRRLRPLGTHSIRPRAASSRELTAARHVYFLPQAPTQAAPPRPLWAAASPSQPARGEAPGAAPPTGPQPQGHLPLA